LNNSEASLHLFLNGFSARDIAEPLPSFDESTSARVIEQALREQHQIACGIRSAGFNVGWLTLDELTPTDELVRYKSFREAAIVTDTTSLTVVICELDAQPIVFVQTLGQVCGVIRRSSLDKPAMRMWLFGLLTISELRVTDAIEEFCPNESWRQYLSDGRLKLAEDLQTERRRRGENRSLLECLQVADKGQIVARDPRLREDTRFSSRRAVEEFVKQLQHLRNNLAHSQEITNDWDIILDLATNLHRVVLGPNSTASTPDLTNTTKVQP